MRWPLAILLVTSVARAEPPPAPEPPPVATYPRPVLVADAIAAGLFAGGYALAGANADCECEDFGSMYLLGFGVMGYVGVPAAIHVDRGHRGRAVASVALRVALPIAAGYGADALAGDRTTAFAAVLGGAGAAMLIDWTVLTRVGIGRTTTTTVPVTLFGAPASGGAVAGLAGRW